MNNDQDKGIEDTVKEFEKLFRSKNAHVTERDLSIEEIEKRNTYYSKEIVESTNWLRTALRSYGSKEYERGIKDSQWTALNKLDYERGRKSVLDELAEEELKLRKGFAYKPRQSIK